MSSFAAIDIGATKVAAVVAEVDAAGNPRLLGIATTPYHGLRKGRIHDANDTAKAVSSALKKAETMAGKPAKEVAVAVSGEAIDSRPARGLVPILDPNKPITREDVHRVINHSKQTPLPDDCELILAVPRAFRVDGRREIQKPIGTRGQRLEAETLLVTAPSEQLDEISACVQTAGVEVQSWVPKGVASGEAATTLEERELGVVVIDIGGDLTDVAVFHKGTAVALQTVPVGSNHITKDIAVLLKTSVSEAERLKKDAGTCGEVTDGDAVYVEQEGTSQRRPFERRVLAQIVHARAKEILTMSLQCAQGIAPGVRTKGGIVLTGGGSRLHGIGELASKVGKGARVRIGDPEPMAGLGDLLAGPEFATAAGLVRFGARLRDRDGVAAETGDLRRLLRGLGSNFSSKETLESKQETMTNG